MHSVAGGTVAAAAAEREEAVEERSFFPSFIRYNAPQVVPGVVRRSRAASQERIHLLDRSQEGYYCSIPAAKLAAAKSAAREAFLNAQRQESLSFAGAAAAAGGGGGNALGGSRQDPSHRLPTPPVAGRRCAGGRARRGGGGKSVPADGKGSMPPTAPAASPSTAAASTPTRTQQQQQRDLIGALMHTADKPDRFLAQILNGMFPPKMSVIDVDGDHRSRSGRGLPEGAEGSENGRRADIWNEGGESHRQAAGKNLQGLRSATAEVVQPISVQHVSHAPATREEVTLLHDALRHRLQERRAKPSDLCSIRRAIYNDVFCEVMRQVTVEEPARGVLLQRIKQDADHTLEVHADLLARAHFFAACKAQDAQRSESCDNTSSDSMGWLRAKLEALQKDKVLLEARRHELLAARDALEQRIDEEQLARNKACQEELAYLRRANQQLSIRLKAETERTSANNVGGGGSISNAPGEAGVGIAANE